MITDLCQVGRRGLEPVVVGPGFAQVGARRISERLSCEPPAQAEASRVYRAGEYRAILLVPGGVPTANQAGGACQSLGQAEVGGAVGLSDPGVVDARCRGMASFKKRHVLFYERHGFRVAERLDLKGGPPVWLMWHNPA